MDFRQTLTTLCLAGGLSLTAACSGKLGPVNNIENAPIYQNQGVKQPEEIRDAIVAGLTEKGWGVLDQSQGWIVARVDVSGHWAKVRITYNATAYTILHFESSPGLSYDGARIHRRYNTWIEQLNAVIQEQLVSPEDEEAAEDEEAPEDEAAPEAEAAEAADVPGAGPEPEPDASWNEGEAPPPG
jgi:hypothetical protein